MMNESIQATGAAIPVPEAVIERKPLAVSDQGVGPYISRFGPVERTTHALVMVSFFGLVITGVPLRFAAALDIRVSGGDRSRWRALAFLRRERDRGGQNPAG